MKINPAHLSAIFAFSMWGLFPLYWKLFESVSAWDLFAHRISWSVVTLTLILIYKKRLGSLKTIWQEPKTRWMLIVSSLLISTNWLLYIYAMNTGRIIESSMGYFLNPLINVFMGWIILKEKIRLTQWPSIVLAMFSMVLIAAQTSLDNFPWLALLLSITFALYGLIRKLVNVNSLEGLTFETFVVIIPVLLYWPTQGTTPLTAWEILPSWKMAVLTLAGVVTCTPLVLFAYSARRLSLTTLGFIQYLSPSLKFLCGLLIFKEALSPERLQAFCLIWVALIWYTLESLIFHKRGKKVVVSE